jgi:hypothetical protein
VTMRLKMTRVLKMARILVMVVSSNPEGAPTQWLNSGRICLAYRFGEMDLLFPAFSSFSQSRSISF